MTPKPFQSKLRPHLEFIRECRAQDMSYPRIAAELRARFGLSAAPSTIFAFVKVRSRRRAVIALPSPAPTRAAAEAKSPAPSPTPTRPPAHAAASAKWLFYDPNKPLEKLPSPSP